jgi:hypothetical protein
MLHPSFWINRKLLFIAMSAAMTMGVLFNISIISLAHAEEAPVSVNTDDWDWGAVTADDLTPADTGRNRAEQEMPQLPPGKAEPDFEAETLQVKQFLPLTPDFEIVPAKTTASMYPCSSCHAWRKVNATPRKLERPHNNFELKHSLHGKGVFWCFTCHDLENPQGLKDLEGNHLSSQESYLLCSQCHSRQAKDWAFGAHGKRLGSWNGQRKSLDCAACHYQHSPKHKPRAPMEGPKIRANLDRPPHWQPRKDRHIAESIRHRPIWERYGIEVTGDQDLEHD